MNLDSTFSALSDPTRRAILSRLATGEATVLELAEPFSMSQPAVSRHLRVLEQAGLIARRIDGARRPCRLLPNGMDQIEKWLEMMRRAMETNYNRLDAILAAQATQGKETTTNEQADSDNRRRQTRRRNPAVRRAP